MTSYNSNFFDGSLTWQPSPLFQLAASVERYIGEPSTTFGILADVRSYGVRATYLPVPGVSVSAGGGWQVVSESAAAFITTRTLQMRKSHGTTTITFNSTQRYTIKIMKSAGRTWEFSEVRVISGVRIVPDGQDLLHGESLNSLITRLGDSRKPANSELTVSGGYSWFGLPDMKMVTVIGGPWFNQALEQQNNGDGNLNGWRTDARLRELRQRNSARRALGELCRFRIFRQLPGHNQLALHV